VTRKRKTEPDPVPALLESLIGSIDAMRAVLLEQLTARAAAAREEWIGQRESPIPARTFTRLCRELCERGDPRAAVRGRVHYLRQAAIDEWLQGSPGAHRTPRELARQNNATKLAQVERELDAIFDPHLSAAEKWRRTLRAEGLIPPGPPPAKPPALSGLELARAIESTWRELDQQVAATLAWKAKLGREPTRTDWKNWRSRREMRQTQRLPWSDDYAIRKYGDAVTGGDDPEPIERDLRVRGLWRLDAAPATARPCE
jgi:hypothetical protein